MQKKTSLHKASQAMDIRITWNAAINGCMINVLPPILHSSFGSIIYHTNCGTGIGDKFGYGKCGEYQFYMLYHALKDDKQITSDNYFDVTRCNCPKQCSGWSFDSIDHDPKIVEEANNSNNSSNASAIPGFVPVVFFKVPRIEFISVYIYMYIEMYIYIIILFLFWLWLLLLFCVSSFRIFLHLPSTDLN